MAWVLTMIAIFVGLAWVSGHIVATLEEWL